MGRGATFYCKTCKVAIYLGYGSASTWADDCASTAEFDARVVADPALGTLKKNQNMRTCLEQHAGHTVMTHSSDWTHPHNGKLCGEFGSYGSCVTLIDDYDQWTHEDLWEQAIKA